MPLKKLLAVLLTLAMLLSLATVFAGCDNAQSSQSDEDEDEDDDKEEPKDNKGNETTAGKKDPAPTDPEGTDPAPSNPGGNTPDNPTPKIDIPEAAAKALDDVIQAEIGAQDKLYASVPAVMWDYWESTSKMSYDDFIAYYPAYKEYLANEIGQDIRVSYTINEATKYDEFDMEWLIMDLVENKNYGLDAEKFEEAYGITTNFVVNGEEREETSLILLCYDGSWYVLKEFMTLSSFYGTSIINQLYLLSQENNAG